MRTNFFDLILALVVLGIICYPDRAGQILFILFRAARNAIYG